MRTAIAPYSLLFISISLMLLPLQKLILAGFYGDTWDTLKFVNLGVLLVIYSVWVCFGRTSEKLILTEPVFITVVLVAVFLTAADFSVQLDRYLWLLSAAWAFPLIRAIKSQYGHALIGLILVGIIVVHSCWGIGQFILQRDFGLQVIGESNIDRHSVGVAKFSSTGGDKLIRAYGPHPHANSLSGTLLLGVIMCLFVVSGNRDTWSGSSREVFAIGLLLVLVLGMLVSFSRASLLGLLIALGIFLWEIRKNVAAMYAIRVFLVPILITLIVFTPLLVWRVTDLEDQALTERSAGAGYAFELMGRSPLQGVGVGGYPLALQQLLLENSKVVPPWQIDYVHSIPLLLAVEWGIPLCIVLIAGFAIWTRINLGRKTIWLLPIVPPLLLDHYFITQLGPLVMLTALLSVIAGYNAKNTSKIVTD